VVSRLFAALVSAVLVAALVALPAAVPAANAQVQGPRTADEGSTETSPLAVSIDTLTPSTVPRRGDVTVTGEITNESDSTWTDLYVYLFASSTPMTTSDELEQANGSDESEDVGARLTQDGLYEKVDDLKPGQSTTYKLTVPRSSLPFDGPGVYWLGVHVLGTSDEGRLPGADGRARTFIASMPERRPLTTMSLVVPLRAQVRRTADGRLANLPVWTRRFAEDGRLSRLVALDSTAPDVPVSWVVDPAVLEAARSVAEGDPPFDITPTPQPGDNQESPTPSPSGPLSESPDAGSSDDSPAPEEELSQLSPEAQDASTWLRDFKDLAAQHTVLTLPYGDVDVASLLRNGYDGTYTRANQLSELAMQELGMDGRPVVAPADGLLPDAALEKLDPATTLLLSQRAAVSDATVVRPAKGPDAVLTSDVARIGGPGPTPPFDALALRQRILAEAAVHGLTGDPDQPLVVSTPDLWDPGAEWQSASFFTGLDVPWLRTIDLPLAIALSHPEKYDHLLRYSRVARKREVPTANLRATRDLNASGTVLATLLTRNDTIDAQVGRAAMLGSSTAARKAPREALALTQRISDKVHHLLGEVSVEGSPLVTMSSEAGNFSVTVVNGLDEPVTVGIQAKTGTDELQIRSPDLVSLGAGQRASVRLAVRATGTGVHSVRIVPTTKDGHPLGQATRVKVRSSQVGFVIWLIIGTGAVVFVVAIGARILRRVRDRKRTHGPNLEDITA
jgi:hypothetical protein